MSNIRLSRGHLRYLAAVDRGGGKGMVFIMTILPIFVNFVWTIIYFTERTTDVFSYGPCNLANGTKYSEYATPFFVTNRTEPGWAAQAVFTLLTFFVWAPYRYLRPRATRQWSRFIALLLVDAVTLAPFLLSLVFPPAYISYVPTFLRVWVVKYEVLSLLSLSHKVPYLLAYLAMDILSITITVIGAYEWSVNNFPVEPINYGTLSPQASPVYPCMTFLDSLYWFMVTFATVGYGDIVPTNTIARMFVVGSIVVFLLLLPEFVNKVSAILKSYSDFKEAKFDKAKSNDYLILDGRVSSRMALQTLSILQPKFFPGEITVGYVVVLSDVDNFEGLVTVRDAQAEEYTRLFLMKGSLEASEDAERARAAGAKAVYVLPVAMQSVPYPASRPKHKLGLREATEMTREFSMKRDFDTIRRVWAAQLNVRHAQVRTLLMHKGNSHLVDFTPLSKYSACRCNSVSFLFADSLEQRIGAASALIPAYGTVLVNMMLGGSCEHKSFDEYEADATNLAAIDKLYEVSAQTPEPPHLPFTPSQESVGRQASIRTLTATPDDEQYVRSLRSGLLLVSFMGAQEVNLARICRVAFLARVLVFAFIPRQKMCQHTNFRPETIEWSHQALVKPDDYLICYGGFHEIDIIRKTAFWKLMDLQAANSGLSLGRKGSAGSLTGTKSPPMKEITKLDSATKRRFLREGDFEHLQSDKFVKRGEARRMREAYLKDTRAASELDDGSEEECSDSDGSEVGGRERDSLPRPMHEHLEGHIIVHSASHDNYVYFVRKLRAQSLTNSSIPILLLDSNPPNRFRWSEISHFENVYFLQGRPFILDDLKRAGFEHASCLVLLSDFRASFEQGDDRTTPLVIDRDNLLAEKVASRLRKELECSTRIITHVACEESCEFVGIERMRKVVFQAPFRQRESLQAMSRRLAFSELADIFQQAWHPVTFSSYITGESWSPACYMLVFLAIESKGGWIASFFECMTDTVGTKRGLSFEPVPEDCVTYKDAVFHYLEAEMGLVIGVYKRFKKLEVGRFRGVLMFPQNDFILTNNDMLYVMRGNAVEIA